MQITIDTNEPLSPKQKVAIAALLDFPGTDEWAQQLENGTDTSALAEAKPKATRTRRTKAQIAADEAAAKADAEVLPAEVAETEQKRREENAEAEQETTRAEPTPETKANEADDKASIEKLVEVATKLASENRNALIEILGNHGVKRASQIPADERDAVIAEIGAELERLEAAAKA